MFVRISSDCPRNVGASASKASSGRKPGATLSTLCQVQAHVYYVKTRNIWHITQLSLGHNHVLIPDAGIIDKRQHLTQAQLEFIRLQVTEIRASTGTIKRSLLHQFQIDIEDRLLYNLVAEFRVEAFAAGRPEECAVLLQDLGRRGAVKVQLNDQAQLEMAVYMSSQSQAIATIGGNVFCTCICVDATHQTNRWGLYVVLITVQGPFCNSAHLGTFFLRQETPEAYEWCFQRINELVPGFLNGVRVVMTDGLEVYDSVVTRALFPNAEHVRCLWHLEQQLARQFSSSLGVHFATWWTSLSAAINQYSESDYKATMADCVAQLERSLGLMGREADSIAERVAYMKAVLTHEKKFAMCYTKNLLTLGARYVLRLFVVSEQEGCPMRRSTQRGEASNSAAKCRTATRTYLYDFCHALHDMEHDQAKAMRVNLQQQSQRATAHRPPSDIAARFEASIVRHAAEFYTTQVTRLTANRQLYTVTAVSDPSLALHERVFYVRRTDSDNAAEFSVFILADRSWAHCSCTDSAQRLFVCRHILAVLLHFPENAEVPVLTVALAALPLFGPRYQISLVTTLVDEVYVYLYVGRSSHTRVLVWNVHGSKLMNSEAFKRVRGRPLMKTNSGTHYCGRNRQLRNPASVEN